MVGIPELNPQDKAERCLHGSGAVRGIEEKRASSPVGLGERCSIAHPPQDKQ